MASRTDIASKILIILNDKNGIKAVEIAKIIEKEIGETVDKKIVNSILYSELRGQVSQDSKYKWYLKDQEVKDKRKTNKGPKDENLSKISSYYIECIASELDGISLFAKSKYNLSYYQNDTIDFLSAPAEEGFLNVKKTVLTRKSEQSLSFGYPFFLKSFKSRDGKSYEKVEPIFYLTYDTESISGAALSLVSEQYKINPEAIKSIEGIDRGDLLDEIVDLQEKLGLIDPFNIPDLDELILRLKELKPDWPWKEEIDPGSLSTTKLDQISEHGVYNCAAFFPSERSKFTRGLESELQNFRTMPTTDLSGTALKEWIRGDFSNEKKENQDPLLEPIPLNEEQRLATRKALSQKLTVVTGPPGTGKSQIVTSILINAAFRKQSVLFSSKNNQAVDVVVNRGNAITDRPLVLRLGRDTHQAGLIDHLTTLLSTSKNSYNKTKYDEASSDYKLIVNSLKEIESKTKTVVDLRNEVDEISQNLSNIIDDFDQDQINRYKKFNFKELGVLNGQIDLLHEQTIDFDKSKQDFFTKMLWFGISNQRQDRLSRTLNALHPELKKISKDFQSIPTIDEDGLCIPSLYNLITSVKEKIDQVRSYLVYREALIKLQSSESLFDLSKQAFEKNDNLHKISIKLYKNWLQHIATQLEERERKNISDFLSVLQLIENANENNTKLASKIWAQYYRLLPSVQKTLPCWAVTSLSVKSKVPSLPAFFDLLVIDEASQCDIASAIPLLFRAKRVVVIGDPKQLTHISQISQKQDIQLMAKYDLQEKFLNWGYSSNSLFSLAAGLVKGENIVNLKDHHRSHKHIIQFSNAVFYDGNLRVATKYENLNSIKGDQAVRWIDVSGKASLPPNGSVINQDEANAIVDELQRIVDTGYNGSIGVVTPYRAQANLIIREVTKRKGLYDSLLLRNWLCNTVHLFQGDEKDMMIFSPVISQGLDKNKTRFMSKQGNLFNVAITRARSSLIIIGSKAACSSFGISYLEKFVKYIDTLDTEATSEEVETVDDYGSNYPEIGSDVIVSDWEKKLYESLYQRGIITIPQYKEDQYSLDLALFKNDSKLNIEVDGEQYHRKWDGELLVRDQIRNKRLIELGWDVKRFWVYELKDDLDSCCQSIQDWYEQK